MAVSTGTEFVEDIIDDGKINKNLDDYLGASIGGTLDGLGGGFVSSFLMSGVGNVFDGFISGEITNFKKGAEVFIKSSVSSMVNYGLTSATTSLLAKTKYKKIIGNSQDNITINKKLSKAGFGNVKIGRDGYENVLDTIVTSSYLKKLQKPMSYAYGFILDLLS